MDDQECPVEVCDRRIPLDKLMCRGHWFLVPTPIQRRVYRAWAKRTTGSVPGTPERVAAIHEHQDAKDEAVAAVEQRLAG